MRRLALLAYLLIAASQLALADTQVGIPQRLTNSPYEDRSPAWDPASNNIAYQRSAAEIGSPYDIWQVNADLPGETVLATGLGEADGLAHSLSWVGRTGFLGVAERLQYREYLFFNPLLAPFTRVDYDGDDAAFTVKLLVTRYAGGELLRLSRDGTTALWRWSNNYTKGLQQIRLGLVSSLTGQAAETVGAACISELSQTQAWFMHGAALSPDGSKFVIPLPRSNIGEALDSPGSPHDLWLYNSDCSGTPLNLTHSRISGYHSRYPDISPDGHKVMFTRWNGVPGQTWDLYIINIDGTGLEQITNTSWFTEYEPSWGPDGTRVAFRGQHLPGQENQPPALPPEEITNPNIYVVDVLPDCDDNDTPDLCEIPCDDQICIDRCAVFGCGTTVPDCFTRTDCDNNSIPDNCDPDSDGDGTPDGCDGCINDPLKIDPGYCGCGLPETDSDGDSVPDCADECDEDPLKILVGSCGCGVPETDGDGDGTPDCIDLCPDDPLKTAPQSCGCGTPETDSDSDGTADCLDLCPLDPAKTAPGACGCGIPDTDSDSDGTPDCLDLCPADPLKTQAGICGCGTADTDTDSDGTPDCNDQCSLDPAKTAPGVCGCGTADTDSDSDGAADCLDLCPADPLKTVPGICGCGVADSDGDGDQAADCNDQCPSDPQKTAPGQCGCGLPDLDADGDGTADCSDLCPEDPAKTAPGSCGCGVSDEDSDRDGIPDCIDLCLPGSGGSAEVCDGQDNDCDGQIDEDLDCTRERADCQGIAGGTAEEDHCGVCNGDGTSCADCRFIDLDQLLKRLTELHSKQVKIGNSLLRLLRRGSKQDKRFARQMTAQLTALNLQNTEITVSKLPRRVPICSDDVFCSTVSLEAEIGLYRSNAAKLQRTISRLLKRAARSLASKKLQRLTKTSKANNKEIVRTLAQIPNAHSECR